MWTEYIKIMPSLDSRSLNKMIKSLSGRFAKLGKSFAGNLRKGIGSVFSGGLMGMGMRVFDKMLNPLKEIDARINETFDNADLVVTNAKQFQTSPGKYFSLQKIAESTGLSNEQFNQMLSKFQVSMARAKKGEDTTLKQFKDYDDIIDAFYAFSKSIKAVPKNMQVLAQSKIFGEDLYVKAAELFQTDFNKRTKEIGLRAPKAYDVSLQKIGGIQDKRDILKARRNAEDVLKKGNIMNQSIVNQMDQSERLDLQKENKRIAEYKAIKEAALVGQDISNKIDGLIVMLSKQLPKLTNAAEKIMESRWIRGIFK